MYGQVVRSAPNRVTWSAHCLNVAPTVAYLTWLTSTVIGRVSQKTADKTKNTLFFWPLMNYAYKHDENSYKPLHMSSTDHSHLYLRP